MDVRGKERREERKGVERGRELIKKRERGEEWREDNRREEEGSDKEMMRKVAEKEGDGRGK